MTLFFDNYLNYCVPTPNKLWVVDFMAVQPNYDEATNNIYLCTVMDAYSYIVVASRFFSSKNQRAILSVLKTAISDYGIPQVLCWDNKPALYTQKIARFCIQHNIVFICPNSDGYLQYPVIEDFFYKIYQEFEMEIISPFAYSLAEINAQWQNWLKENQQQIPHSITNQGPQENYLPSVENQNCKQKKGENNYDPYPF